MYWNKLPLDVKNYETVFSLNIKSEIFRKEMISRSFVNCSYFWNVSNVQALGKSEGTLYLINNEQHFVLICKFV